MWIQRSEYPVNYKPCVRVLGMISKPICWKICTYSHRAMTECAVTLKIMSSFTRPS